MTPPGPHIVWKTGNLCGSQEEDADVVVDGGDEVADFDGGWSDDEGGLAGFEDGDAALAKLRGQQGGGDDDSSD